MRRFPFHSSALFILFASLLSQGIYAQEKTHTGKYNSKAVGIEAAGEENRGAVLHTRRQLLRLRKAVPPRYVRIMDLENYNTGKNILVRGILFTFAAYRARNIYLAGNFNNWNLIPMQLNERGVYYHILPVRQIELGVRPKHYEYKFLVDGIWTHDPVNQNQQDDGLGGYLSLFDLEREDIPSRITARILKEVSPGQERLVEFAIHLPQVKSLALVGDFNHWNPHHDLLFPDRDGIFRLRLRLLPGEYCYKYIADERWILDPYNSQTRYHEILEDLCSFINVPTA